MLNKRKILSRTRCASIKVDKEIVSAALGSTIKLTCSIEASPRSANYWVWSMSPFESGIHDGLPLTDGHGLQWMAGHSGTVHVNPAGDFCLNGGLSKEVFEPKVKVCFMRNIFVLAKVAVKLLVLM